jgi:hypothetical protein
MTDLLVRWVVPASSLLFAATSAASLVMGERYWVISANYVVFGLVWAIASWPRPGVLGRLGELSRLTGDTWTIRFGGTGPVRLYYCEEDWYEFGGVPAADRWVKSEIARLKERRQ